MGFGLASETVFFKGNLASGWEVKASACNEGDMGSIPGLGRSPGKGNGNPLQYSCLENPMDGGAWWATVHGVAKSRTLLFTGFLTLRTSLSLNFHSLCALLSFLFLSVDLFNHLILKNQKTKTKPWYKQLLKFVQGFWKHFWGFPWRSSG